jgi:D-arabinose 1-dehydrogenase-like Zn-dependent alcohol dehydrogenase
MTLLYDAVRYIMKAARIIKPKEALQVQDLETPKPKSSQVLVKVLSSGAIFICGKEDMKDQGDNF